MRFKSMKSIWYWLTAVTALLVCVVTITSLLWLRAYGAQRSRQVFETSSAQLQARAESFLQEFPRVARQVSYYSEVQTYLFSSEPLARMASSKLTVEQAGRLLDSYSSILDIRFISQDSTCYSIGNYDWTGLTDIGKMPEPPFSSQSYFLSMRSKSSSRSGKTTGYFVYVFPIYSLEAGTHSRDAKAICMVMGQMADILDLQGDFEINYEAAMILEGDEVLYTNDSRFSAEEASHLPMGWGRMDGHMLTYRTRLAGTSWDAVFIAKERAFSQDSWPIQVFLLCVMALALACMFLLLVLAIRSFSIPVRELKRDLERIGRPADAPKTGFLPPSPLAEMDWIRGNINQMIGRLEEGRLKQRKNEEKLYKATILANQSMLKYYQSQINPHFLYNSLECIRSIAQLRQVEEISDIALSLARVFRYSIDGRDQVPLHVELQNVQDYFNVISVRKPSQYEMRIRCPEPVGELPVMKMILQPLVENAIQHGFTHKAPPYLIHIRCFVREGLLHIVVTDNGVGIGPKQLDRLRQGFAAGMNGPGKRRESIGLKNIYGRLALSEGGGMRLSSRLGCYTQVELFFPADGEGRQ